MRGLWSWATEGWSTLSKPMQIMLILMLFAIVVSVAGAIGETIAPE